MQSGCPHSQAGAYPAFQHQSDVGAFASLHNNHTTPVSEIHPANGTQENMVATQYPGELRVGYVPGQWQQGNLQLQQNFQGFPHLESQPSTASTEFQHPKPRDGTCSPGNSCYQISRKANTNAVPESKKLRFSCLTNPSSSSEERNANIELNTSTIFSDEVHHKSQQVRSRPAALDCGKTGTQSLHHSGGSHATLPQQQVYSPYFSNQPSTDRVLPVGETVPPTDDQIKDHIAKKVAHFRTILTQKNGNSGHIFSNKGWDFCANTRDSTPQSECISSNVAHLPTTSALDKDVKRQSLSCAVDEQCTAAFGQGCEEDSSRGSRANELTPKSKEMSACATPASKKLSTGTLVSDIRSSKHTPKTDSVEKSALVEFELSEKEDLDVTMPANENVRRVFSGDCESKTFVCSNDEGFYSKWCDKYVRNGVTILHYSLTALKELIAALENVETITEMDNFPKGILQQYWNGDIDNIHLFASTEYRQILGEVAATCTKNEDESPVILTAVSGMTLDELTEKNPSSSSNSSSSQEEYKSLWLNTNKNLDHTDQVPSVSRALKNMTEREKGDTSLRPVEAVGLNNVQGVTDSSEDLQTKSSSKLNLLIDKIQVHDVASIPTNQSECLYNHTVCEGVRDIVGSGHLQTDVSIAISTKDKEHTPLCKSKCEEALSVNILKNPEYEDISDDEDMPQLATKLPNTEHKELRISAHFEDFHYVDISEDENPQIENMAVERPSLTQVPEPNNTESPFERFESCGHVQAQALTTTEIISDEELIPMKVLQEVEALDAAHCSSSCFVETEDAKCSSHIHQGWKTNHSDSYSPSFVLKEEDETDDQMDDDWLVIPLSMSDLKFEAEDEEDSSEKVVLDDGEIEDRQTQCDTNQVPASPPSQMEVFDTIECFLQAKYVQFTNGSTPEHELDCEGKPHRSQNRRESYSEPENSCDTEDSCEYSPGSERNYLTVPRQLLKMSATLFPGTADSVSEKEDEDEVGNVQKGQTRSSNKSGCMQKLKQLIRAKTGSRHVQHNTNRQNISKKDDIIIILDSDTEDESDQNGIKRAKRKKIFSSGSDDSGDAPAPQQHSNLHDTKFKEVTPNALFDLSHSSEKSGQLMETKGGSKHVLHKSQKISKKESVIILDSDTEDGIDQNYKKATSKRAYSSASADGGHASCVHQKIHSCESGDSEYESAEVKPRDTRVSFGDSSLLQHQSKLHDTHSKELMQDIRSERSHSSEKSGQLIEAHRVSGHIQQKTNRQMMPEERGKTKRTHSSGSEDTGDALFPTKTRPSTETVNYLFKNAKKKTKKLRLSSEDLPKKLPQSVGKETDSTLNPNPVIPRLAVVKSSQPTEYLTLVKESTPVHMQVNDGSPSPKTLTLTSNCTDCEKNTQKVDRNKRFMSKSKPANGRRHSTSVVQTSIVKPALISRQSLLPCQEGPSTSIGSLSCRSGQLSEARQISASCRGLPQSGEASNSCDLSKSKQSTSTPRQHLPSTKMHLSRSFSNPPPSDYLRSNTKGPSFVATKKLSARDQVINDWGKSFFPTRRDRKRNLEEELTHRNNDSRSDTRQGPSHYDRAPRQRHNSLKSAAPLMKKTRPFAEELTRARIRDVPVKQRCPVGDGYKWSEKPTMAKPTEGFSRRRERCRTPSRPHP